MIRVFRHLLFTLAFLVGMAAWFVETTDPSSRIGRALAPGYAPAITGYRLLLKQALPLSSHDQGFAELLELVAIDAPQIVKERVATLRLAGLDFVPSGNGIYIECIDVDGHTLGAATILNPETAIKQHFFAKRIRRTKGLSLVGLVLSAFMYIGEVLERRRREQRDRVERTRVNEELAVARSELSNLKARQAPNAVFDAVKQAAEWAERRGGPKNPFRT